MPPNARVASRILRRVQERNRELMIDAAIEAAMGVLWTALTSGVVFCVAWFVLGALGGRGFPASKVALGVAGVFVAVGFVSEWRRVDPFAGLKPMSHADHMLVAAGHAINGYVHVNRHTIAGMASLLQAGPGNLVGALGTWLHRLPSDSLTIDQAAGILSACRPEIDLEQVDASSMRAAVLLRRLNMVVPRSDSTFVTLTQSGRDVVS